MKKLFAAMLALSTLTALTGPVEAQMTSGRQRQSTPLQADEAQKKKAAEKAEPAKVVSIDAFRKK